MDFPSLAAALLTNSIGAACAGAILWLVYWRETKATPKMIEAFAKLAADSQLQFATRQAELLKTFADLSREERTNYQKWHEENRSRLDMILVGQKEGRHTVNNLAHELGMKKAIEAAEKRANP